MFNITNITYFLKWLNLKKKIQKLHAYNTQAFILPQMWLDEQNDASFVLGSKFDGLETIPIIQCNIRMEGIVNLLMNIFTDLKGEVPKHSFSKIDLIQL